VSEATEARVRPAEPADVPVIHRMILELAEYERLRDEVRATEADLREALFGPRPAAEAAVAEEAGEAVGFALFFANYSTFVAAGAGAGLRAGRVGGPGVERAGHPLLPRRGGPAAGGLAVVAADGRGHRALPGSGDAGRSAVNSARRQGRGRRSGRRVAGPPARGSGCAFPPGRGPGAFPQRGAGGVAEER